MYNRLNIIEYSNIVANEINSKQGAKAVTFDLNPRPGIVISLCIVGGCCFLVNVVHVLISVTSFLFIYFSFFLLIYITITVENIGMHLMVIVISDYSKITQVTSIYTKILVYVDIISIRDDIKRLMSDKKLNSHCFQFDPPPPPQN
jgi:hypothetical protein